MMCKWDEGFTVDEMRKETGRCEICKLDCPYSNKAGEQE